MPQPLILHLYMSQKLMKHSEINDIQNNQTENSCQEVCRLQEINASQDQLMISHTLLCVQIYCWRGQQDKGPPPEHVAFDPQVPSNTSSVLLGSQN